MENEHYGRFIFMEFGDLKTIKFDKLEQVCDRVFVFVNDAVQSIPLTYVQHLQKLGENVQWIAVSGNSERSTCSFMGFYLGRMHEEEDTEVEFAIISEEETFDSLIDLLNEEGRSAIRVTNSKSMSQHRKTDVSNWSSDTNRIDKVKQTNHAGVPSLTKSSEVTTISKKTEAAQQPAVNTFGVSSNQELSSKVARETLKRLVMSGNRPAAIETLKSYILLQYNDAEVSKNIDLIIRKLEGTKEIEVKNKEVLYHF